MVTRRLSALLVAVLAIAAGCGAERPELQEADGLDGSETTEVIVVGDQVTDDDRSQGDDAAAGQSATGLSARALAPEPEGQDLPPLVVLDTDMGPDIDDALALAMLHTYQDRELAEIAAVTLSRNSTLGARFIDAMNTWYGHPDIPIGIDRRSPYTMNETNSYVSLADRWPNDVANEPIADGVTVLRRVLARAIAEERRVIIVQVGFSGNTAALLDSGPDDISAAGGTELVTGSAALLSIMAGSMADRVEFNVANDVAAARRVIDGWPGDMVLSPFGVGYDLHYPYAAIRDRLAGDDLIRQAYEFRDYDWHVDAPPFYDMRTWDLTSVMVAIEPDAGWFPRSDWGLVSTDGSGRTFFTPGSGRHRILVRGELSNEDLDRASNGMIELVSASSP